MDYIFFYAENEDKIKSVLSQLNLDPQRSPKKIPISNNKILYKEIVGKKEPLLYYIEDSIADKDRIILNSLNSRIDDLKICLVSKESSALIAWEYDLFDFKKTPATVRNFKETYHKYSRNLGRVFNYIPLKTSEGLFKLPVRDINYLQAQEQYTMIHRNIGEQYKLESKNIGYFVKMLEGNKHLKKVHRSYMINVSNIRSINEKEITFYGKGKTLTPVTRILGRRIRKEIFKE